MPLLTDRDRVLHHAALAAWVRNHLARRKVDLHFLVRTGCDSRKRAPAVPVAGAPRLRLPLRIGAERDVAQVDSHLGSGAVEDRNLRLSLLGREERRLRERYRGNDAALAGANGESAGSKKPRGHYRGFRHKVIRRKGGRA